MYIARRLWKFRDSVIAHVVLAFVVGAGLLSGVAAFRYGADIYKAYVLSRDWHRTQGTIVTSSGVHSCGGGRYGSHFALSVTYTYDVEGKTYTSDRVWFGNGVCSNAAEAELRANKYLPGATVFIYYDPLQPFESVLYPGTVENGTLFLFAVFVVPALGCTWLFATLVFGAIRMRAQSEGETVQTEKIDSYIRANKLKQDEQ